MNKLYMVIVLIIFASGIAFAQMGEGMMNGGMMGEGMGPGMMGSGQGFKNTPLPREEERGVEIFRYECARCHAQGGNVIYPNLPLQGSSQLKNFPTFLKYLRNPVMPDGSPGSMPAFSSDRLSGKQAEALYKYLGETGMIPH